MRRQNKCPLALAFTFILSTTCTAQWIDSSKPGLGTVVSFVEIGNIIFAGANSNDNEPACGVLRTTDNGHTWYQVNNGLTNIQVHGLAVSGNKLYAQTTNGGIFLSSDSGMSWRKISNNLFDTTSTYGIATIGSHILIGVKGGIIQSFDGGVTWSRIYFGLAYRNISSFATLGAYVFAGAYYEGIYRSTNGVDWKRMNNGIYDSLINCLSASGSNLFAGTDNGVFQSLDSGSSWNKIYSTESYVNCIAVSKNKIFIGYNGIDFSPDNGSNWGTLNGDFPGHNVQSLGIFDNTIFAGVANSNLYSRPLSEITLGVRPNHPFPASPRMKKSHSDALGRSFAIRPEKEFISFPYQIIFQK